MDCPQFETMGSAVELGGVSNGELIVEMDACDWEKDERMICEMIGVVTFC